MGSGVSQRIIGCSKPQNASAAEAASSTPTKAASDSSSSTNVHLSQSERSIRELAQAGHLFSHASGTQAASEAHPSRPAISVSTTTTRESAFSASDGPPTPFLARSISELKARLMDLVGKVPTSVVAKSELVALVDEAEHRASFEAIPESAAEEARRSEDSAAACSEGPPIRRRSEGSELLPAPWIQKESQTQAGRVYYVNVETNETTWTLPDEVVQQMNSPGTGGDSGCRRRRVREVDVHEASSGRAESAGTGEERSSGAAAAAAQSSLKRRVSAVHSDTGVMELCILPEEDLACESAEGIEKEKSSIMRLESEVPLRSVLTVTGEELKLSWAKGDVLGRGAIGTVFKALDQHTGQFFAVKEVSLITGNDEDKRFLERVENEVDIMKELSHPHIVRYLGHDYVNSCLYLYMEHMPGGTLKEAIAEFGHFDEPLIAGYARQLLAGLEYLHGQRVAVIHGDLKSSNILLGADTRIKLADFGCSRRAQSSCLTVTLRGSIPWMAPEVVAHCQYSRASDIWSFGCVCIEMGSGKTPWGSFDNHVQAFLKIGMSEETPPLPVGLTDTGASFIGLCVLRAPEARPDTAALLMHPFVHGIRLLED